MNAKGGARGIWRLHRSLAFVWRSAPAWATANGLVILVQGILPLVLLYLLKLIVDLVTVSTREASAIVEPQQIHQLWLYVGLAALTGVLSSLATAAGRLIGEAQAQAVTDHMYGILHGQSVQVDLAYYENAANRDTLHRAQRQAAHRPGRIVNSVLDFTRSGVSLAVMAGLLTSFHPLVLPVLIAATLPGLFLRVRSSAGVYSWELRATPRERLSAYQNRMLTSEEFATEQRLYGLGSIFRERFARLRTELRREKLSVTMRRSITEFGGETIAVIGVFGVLGAMGYSALTGAISVGSLIMYHGGLRQAWRDLGQMLRCVSDLYENSLFLTDLFEFLDVKPRVTSPANPKPALPPEKASLRVEGVHFRYPHDERWVLRGVDLEMKPGEHVALVGRNGCGKTTLVKLLCRLYDPVEGAVRYGGVDLRELELSEHRRRIGVLMQDFCRYQMTVRENVWVGDVALDRDSPRIDAALEQAGARAFVDRLPRGAENMLGTTFGDGCELSVGEWQKLALARMLARGAKILLLDEPTSAMDAEAEEELIRKLREIAVGRTTLVISHRLAAVKQLDRILYLEDGVVVEQGAHDELMARRGGYARLFELQSRHYR